MSAPLEGIRIVDLTRAMAGPYCSMMLADMGAEVIKVEVPGKGDESRSWGPPFQGGESAYFLSINRNKRSITLDLKKEPGREVLSLLLRRADVLLENFSPGTMARLGFSYDRVKDLNPRIVYCSISGFGQSGPQSHLPAYDQILQGMGGLMSITGPDEGPPIKVGVAIADIAAGIFGAFATLAALYHRQQTGVGQWVDTSLLDSQVALLSFQAGRYFATGEAPGCAGNHHPLLAPSGAFRTGDGYVCVAAGNDKLWQCLCRAMAYLDLLDDPRFGTNPDRVANRDALVAALEERFSALSTQEIVKRLEAEGIPAGPIRNLHQVFSDPQVLHLGLKQTVQHPTAGEIAVTGIPYRFSASPAQIRRPPPLLGEHTEEVLQELGLGKEEVSRLREEGVI
ncbi:MAG TPA: CoA transferase [Dehalococcoidia bacterium]|nr:CoA transferase [Dehalococcoidia bacterium]